MGRVSRAGEYYLSLPPPSLRAPYDPDSIAHRLVPMRRVARRAAVSKTRAQTAAVRLFSALDPRTFRRQASAYHKGDEAEQPGRRDGRHCARASGPVRSCEIYSSIWRSVGAMMSPSCGNLDNEDDYILSRKGPWCRIKVCTGRDLARYYYSVNNTILPLATKATSGANSLMHDFVIRRSAGLGKRHKQVPFELAGGICHDSLDCLCCPG